MKNKAMRATVFAMALLGGVWSGNTLAGISVTYETKGQDLFQFEAPDGWEIRSGKDFQETGQKLKKMPDARIVSLVPPKSEYVMWTGFWAPEKLTDLEAAKTYIAGVAPKILPNANVTFQENRSLNGLQAYIASGSGDREGRSFDFAIIAVQISASRVVIAAFIGEPEAYDRYEKTLILLMNSITSVKGKK